LDLSNWTFFLFKASTNKTKLYIIYDFAPARSMNKAGTSANESSASKTNQTEATRLESLQEAG
jgi:hypothetical protein